MIGYFSGTGNSLYAAKKLAELTGDRPCRWQTSWASPNTCPIEGSGLSFPSISATCRNRCGILSPKRPSIRGPISLASPPAAEREADPQDLSRLLKKRGCDLAYGLVLPMIANSTVASRRHIHYDMNRLDRADDVLHDCADDIRRQVRDASEVTGSLAADVMNFGPLRSLGNYWLTPSVDPKKCVSCGICTKICPVDNIQSTSSGAVIGPRCSRCLACLHWCPHQP